MSKTSLAASPRCVLSATAAALLAGLIGCGADAPVGPKTYKVTGKVIQYNGSPLTGGLVEFQSKSNADLTTNSVIGDDGSFTLQTMTNKQRYPGAADGVYKVSVIPPLVNDGSVQPTSDVIQVKEEFTVKPSDDNYFEVKLPKPAA